MDRYDFEMMLLRVLTAFDLTKEEFFSNSKKTRIVDARYMLYYILRERGMRITYIVDYMYANGFYVTPYNVSIGIKRVKKNIKRNEYKRIKKLILRGGRKRFWLRKSNTS